MKALAQTAVAYGNMYFPLQVCWLFVQIEPYYCLSREDSNRTRSGYVAVIRPRFHALEGSEWHAYNESNAVIYSFSLWIGKIRHLVFRAEVHMAELCLQKIMNCYSSHRIVQNQSFDVISPTHNNETNKTESLSSSFCRYP